jgi:hypothetical protein
MSDNRHSPTAPPNPVTIAAWRAPVADDSGKAFAELVHEGSVFDQAVRNAIRQSSRLYDRLEFTHRGTVRKSRAALRNRRRQPCP